MQTGKNPLCPYCGAPTQLRDSRIVYGWNGQIAGDPPYGNMLMCCNYPKCDTYVGTHKHGKWMNYPLGRLADSDLRSAKKLAHSQFDMLWKTRVMSRSESYKWLQDVMQKEEGDAHIGEMDFDECLKVYNLAKEKFQLNCRV